MTAVQDEVRIQAAGVPGSTGSAAAAAGGGGGGGGLSDPDEVQPEPLDMAFPSGLQKQCTYLVLFPIIFPLWLTLPDTRSQKGELSSSTLTFLLCRLGVCGSGCSAPSRGGGGREPAA